MPDLPLTLACGDYHLNRALVDGRVRVDGVALTVLASLSTPERHRRMIRYQEFDACELALSTYFAARTRGLPFVAIPAFPSRRFRHSWILVGEDAAIREPADLAGKRIAVRNFSNPAALWQRGLLADDYGVALASCRWLLYDEEDVPFTPPSHFDWQRLPAGTDPFDLLRRGAVDAHLAQQEPEALPPGVRRLFPDYAAVEADYYRRTGVFPIGHCIVLREAIAREHPWLPARLLAAFRAAKDVACRELRDAQVVALAWARHAYEQQLALMGPDPWQYSLAGSRPTLEAMLRYCLTHGIVREAVPLEALFAPTTVDDLGR